jgi:hypothetical protein
MSEKKPEVKAQKRKKKEYWSKEQEVAVAKYLSLRPDSLEADRLFATKIYEPLKKLVENIMFTYRLTIPEMDVEEQVFDTISFVVTKFDKFDPEKGHKSFSYYGTVAKNYMIAQRNKSYNVKIKRVNIESIFGFEFDQGLFEEHEFEREYKSHGFLFKVLADELENMTKTDLTLDNNVYKLSEAIVYLLRNYQQINVHNKRQFYFLAREFTGLSAKEITKSLVKIKDVFSKTHKSLQ